MAKRRYTLTRDRSSYPSLHPKRGKVTWENLTIREVGMAVAFTAYDNLAQSKERAAAHGLEAEAVLRGGGVYQLGIFTFTTTEEKQ